MARWKQVVGHEDYQVSDDGQIISMKRKKPRALKQDNSGGYLRVTLDSNCRYLVHRLVAMSFLPNPDNLPMINHKDGNKQNNTVDNLEWCTCQSNTVHAFSMNLRKSTEDHANATRSNAEIHEVCRLIQAGHKRGYILDQCPTVSKACFDDIRSRKTWVRISQHYNW